MKQDIRWKQRFENFERAYGLLNEVFENRSIDTLSLLEKEGVIQRFEYTYELAWKTLKDYLEYSGYALEQITPRFVIKTAFSAGIIRDGQAWIDMIEHRNLMSHTYSESAFVTILDRISRNYLPVIGELFDMLKEKSAL